MSILNKNKLLQLTETAVRWQVCAVICMYGIAKLFGSQFGTGTEILADLCASENPRAMGVMWLFFAWSFEYNLFIGISQVLGGVLLLFPRTKLLGTAILLPILANIIVADIYFEVLFGALFTAVWLLGGLFFILWYERAKILKVLTVLTQSDFSLAREAENKKVFILRLLTTGVIFIILMAVWQILMNVL